MKIWEIISPLYLLYWAIHSLVSIEGRILRWSLRFILGTNLFLVIQSSVNQGVAWRNFVEN